MKLELLTLILGLVDTNTYILYDEDTKKALIIDPAGCGQAILEQVEQNKLNVDAILITHGHFDHIQAVDKLREALGVPAYATKPEAKMAADPFLNASAMLPQDEWLSCIIKHYIEDLADDLDMLDFGWVKLEVINTPGHTGGHVSFFEAMSSSLFVGDCIFKGGIHGRVDLPTSNHEDLKATIKLLFKRFDAETKVYTGHGEATTIGEEKKFYER